MNIIKLNELMKRSLDVQSMKEVCAYIAVNNTYCTDSSYDDLVGSGPGSKALSLIDYCRRRRAVATLIEGISAVRSDVLGSDFAAWHSWAAGEDAK
jgi:hypothetical protein